LKTINALKILQIIQRSQLRGAELFTCQLSEELQKHGHQVDVLVLFGKESDIFKFDLPFFYLEADEKKRWWDFRSYKKLSLFIKKGKYDIVQANAGDTLKYASISKKIYKWKSKFIFRNANKISGFLHSRFKKSINTWLMQEVDYVASVSQECTLDFKNTFPFIKNNIAYLPIGVNLEIPKSYNSLAEIGISGDGPFLLHVGGFMPEKNHEGLIRIFANLIKEIPNAKLLLIGEGKLKSEVEALVSQMKLSQNVVFLGRRRDVQQIMSCCHALVLPSLIEGLPGVILESFVNKLPVVAYNVGGIKEVVIDKKTGWLVAVNNENSFLIALKESLFLPTEEIKENGYSLATQNYSNITISKQFLEFYKNALEN
jgi:glycosyltransferase involved in cell wall biosynthesis